MDLPKLGIAYALVPFKRNQDVIKIHEFGNGEYCIAVADGWNRVEVLLVKSTNKVFLLRKN